MTRSVMLDGSGIVVAIQLPVTAHTPDEKHSGGETKGLSVSTLMVLPEPNPCMKKSLAAAASMKSMPVGDIDQCGKPEMQPIGTPHAG